jgi:bifunctional non-homologous end joining protein LigD
LAQLLEQEHPKMVVSDMKKSLRTGKVFVDWSQNDEHKTTVAVYSLRARERPTVSTPVSWDEVEHTLTKKDANRLVFEAPQTVSRVEKMGDLFAPALKLKQRLPDLQAVAGSGAAETDAPVSIAAQAEEEPRKVRRRAAKKVAKPRTRKTARKV